MRTPIAFFIFNRPSTTQSVFEVIRKVRPPKLLVIADGPRLDRPGEAEKCVDTRSVIEAVDWDCEVLKKYSSSNLGCAKNVAEGLEWIFSHVDEAIILEDDNFPHLSFFDFCEELLEHYRYDEKVMSICGTNVQFGRKSNGYSYYFSLYNHTWGWATWKRAWQHYDFDMALWPDVRESDMLQKYLKDPRAVDFWTEAFQATCDGKLSSYAYRWMLAAWINEGLSIIPNTNLVSNIGFGEGATHTVNDSETSQFANMDVGAISFPLEHPPSVIRDSKADRYTQNTLWHPTFLARASAKLRRMLKKLPILRTQSLQSS